ncbi:MAG: zinc transporter ZntB [Phycisphaerales bacterium]|nr:MAG: zinc transporter ZntB [Phycisphaerales bacterium]
MSEPDAGSHRAPGLAPSDPGVFRVLRLNGAGGATPVDALDATAAAGETIWIDLDRRDARAQAWVREAAGLDPMIAEALIAEDTRPRHVIHPPGALVLMRGVNLTEGANPEDMLSVRVWGEPGRVITLHVPGVHAVEDAVAAITLGAGPRDAGELIVTLAERLVDRAQPVVAAVDDAMDEAEERLLGTSADPTRTELSATRRRAIILRRFLAPKRDALVSLMAGSSTGPGSELFNERHRARLREAADRLTRLVEDLDAVRERATIVMEQVAAKVADRMNQRVYILSLVAAVFLPLGLLTGLLGINVGGIPLAESRLGFAIVSGGLLAIAVGLTVLFRRMRWL